MKIYNTLSRQLEELVPIDQKNVRLFVCGPTVYGPMHAGHAKTYIQFDFVANVIRRAYPSLRYAMNITDVDNKLIKRAAEEKTSVEAVARTWEAAFWEAMEALGNRQVDEVYRAHDHVDEVIDQVRRLMELGKAYLIEGSGIYFDLTQFPTHGSLAQRREQNEEFSRLENGVEKRSAGDFVLWKFAKAGEPSWEAPFGAGRPGWHIEDTAITEKHLGSSYDIHGGATDLIFPHHEAEIAQMEGITGEPLVRYWMHTGLLSIDGRKMGKSLHNFIAIQEMLKSWDWRTLRYAFIATHYRSTMELSDTVLESAQAARARVEEFHRRAPEGEKTTVSEEFWSELMEDINTPRALAVLFTAIRKDPDSVTRGDLEFINELMGNVFDFTEKAAPEEVVQLAEERLVQRAQKNWSESDGLRKQISQLGWEIRDLGDSYALEKK